MLRIIVAHTYQNGPDTCGTEHKTFDIDAPEVEKFIAKAFGDARVVGAEIRPDVPTPAKEGESE